MGPFPHSAPKAAITPANPAGTDGFEFVEFAHPEPQALRDLFTRMGYTLTARHRTRDIELWQQGDVTYILNSDPESHAARFAAKHGPCAASMGWRVVDAANAFAHAVRMGATPYAGDNKALDVPAIVGIGGSLIYFVEDYGPGRHPYSAFDFITAAKPAGASGAKSPYTCAASSSTISCDACDQRRYTNSAISSRHVCTVVWVGWGTTYCASTATTTRRCVCTN
jgi:4-hydroxyphenylpyruvate dioxygenase